MKVFISKAPSESVKLTQALGQKDVELVSQSLIQTSAIAFEMPRHRIDWLFFSSKNAVRHFFKAVHVPAGVKLGAIGNGTAGELSKFGRVDYVGNGDPISVKAEFASLVGSEFVVFPVAEASLKTIQRDWPPENHANVFCYRTMSKPRIIPACVAYVFTSPSNVNSFLSCNKLPVDGKMLAGPTTSRHISSLTGVYPHVLKDYEVSTICEAIFSLPKS
jgi:uroporphyrinogen-III synthase